MTPSRQERRVTATPDAPPPAASRIPLGFLAIVGVLLLGVALWQFVPGAGPPPPPRGAGRVYPRMPAPPQNPGELLRTLGVGSLVWYVSLLAAPLLLWLARRLPLERARAVPALAVHGAVLLGLVTATGVAQFALVYRGAPMRPPLASFLLETWAATALPLLAVAALVHAFEAWRRARDQELAAARLGEALAEARLDALTTQLQPHFLFNALQGVSTLIHRDPAAADAMLGRVSDLLREVLRRDGRSEVPIAEELRVLDAYLDVARQRLGDRLRVDVEVAPDVRTAMVPFFLLQPLVENAVQHGIARRASGGRLAIRARRDGSMLRLEVADDGVGLPRRERERHREGIGLGNTRERLERLYGDQHRFTIAGGDGDGVTVTILIPFRTAPEGAPAPDPLVRGVAP